MLYCPLTGVLLFDWRNILSWLVQRRKSVFFYLFLFFSFNKTISTYSSPFKLAKFNSISNIAVCPKHCMVTVGQQSFRCFLMNLYAFSNATRTKWGFKNASTICHTSHNVISLSLNNWPRLNKKFYTMEWSDVTLVCGFYFIFLEMLLFFNMVTVRDGFWSALNLKCCLQVALF